MDHAKLAALQDPDSIFSGLTGQDWTDIAGRAVQIAFVRGRELLTQGEAGDSLLILTEGSARVSMLTAGGREIVLAYAEPGAVLGERSEEHTSELQSLMRISYAVFCLKKKKNKNLEAT